MVSHHNTHTPAVHGKSHTYLKLGPFGNPTFQVDSNSCKRSGNMTSSLPFFTFINQYKMDEHGKFFIRTTCNLLGLDCYEHE